MEEISTITTQTEELNFFNLTLLHDRKAIILYEPEKTASGIYIMSKNNSAKQLYWTVAKHWKLCELCEWDKVYYKPHEIIKEYVHNDEDGNQYIGHLIWQSAILCKVY